MVKGSIVLKESNSKSLLFLNNNYFDNNQKLINNEDFIYMINSLSSNIKDLFKNTKKGLTHIKSSSDTIIDQILHCKSNISDMFLQLNTSATSSTKISQKPSNGRDKPLREKLNLIMDKMDKINELRADVGKDVKFLEQNSNKFYDEAKLIFKKLKQLQIDQTKTFGNDNFRIEEEIMNTNSNNNNFQIPARSLNFSNSPINYIPMNSELNKGKCYEEERIVQQIVESLKKQNMDLITQMSNAHEQLSLTRIENVNLKEQLKKLEFYKKKFDLDFYKERPTSYYPEHPDDQILASKIVGNNKFATSKSQDHIEMINKPISNKLGSSQSQSMIRMVKKNSSVMDKKKSANQSNASLINLKNTNSTSPTTKLNNYVSSTITISPKNNNFDLIDNNLIIKLAEMVVSFVLQMSSLQEAITSKVTNIKELKQKFELNKRCLNKLATDILSKNMFRSTSNYYQSKNPILSDITYEYINKFNNTNYLATENLKEEYTYNNNQPPPESGNRDTRNSLLKDDNLPFEVSNPNQIPVSKEINPKIFKNSIIGLPNDNNTELFEKEKRLLKKEIEMLSEKVSLLSSENTSYKAKKHTVKDSESSKDAYFKIRN